MSKRASDCSNCVGYRCTKDTRPFCLLAMRAKVVDPVDSIVLCWREYFGAGGKLSKASQVVDHQAVDRGLEGESHYVGLVEQLTRGAIDVENATLQGFFGLFLFFWWHKSSASSGDAIVMHSS